MSQPATETPAPARPAGKRENVLTRKIGPLPTWAWVAIISALIIGYAYIKNRNSQASTSSPTGTDASQVPQFVNQTYTTVTPPPAPVPGPQGPQCPPGPPGPLPPIPLPPVNPGGAGGQPGNSRTVTVEHPGTLRQIAKRREWSAASLLAVEKANKLRPGSRLKKGQKLVIPAGVRESD